MGDKWVSVLQPFILLGFSSNFLGLDGYGRCSSYVFFLIYRTLVLNDDHQGRILGAGWCGIAVRALSDSLCQIFISLYSFPIDRTSAQNTAWYTIFKPSMFHSLFLTFFLVFPSGCVARALSMASGLASWMWSCRCGARKLQIIVHAERSLPSNSHWTFSASW